MKNYTNSKRRFLAAALAAGIGMAAAGSARAADESLNVLIWGVTWQSAIKDISEDFTKQTGIKVNLVTQASSGDGLAKLQAMRSRPTVDVWFTTASVATRSVSDDQLFAPLPTEQMPHLKELPAGAATSHYAAVYSYPTSIIYRTDLVSEPITAWADLWDARFRKKLAMPAMGMYQGRLLMAAAGQHGGDPLDEQRGFAALEALKPNVVMFYGSDAQARQALAQGEVAVLVAPPSQGKRVADAGLPVKVVSPKPAVMNFDVMMIVRSGKEAAAAKFIDHLVSAPVNEEIAKRLNMSAVNVKSAQPEALRDQLPRPEDIYIPDEAVINERIADWLDQFNAKIVN
ncbi:extracellular solute-binding protein [Alcaligenaceae bacterium]|nr:extracellular solute-binding protein [Alcaligenaceae bacterium]